MYIKMNINYLNKHYFALCLFKQRKMNMQNETAVNIHYNYFINIFGKSCRFHAAHANFLLMF